MSNNLVKVLQRVLQKNKLMLKISIKDKEINPEMMDDLLQQLLVPDGLDLHQLEDRRNRWGGAP